ncbi:hypothetical protein D3C87_1160400 [compost metagenome]
MRRAHCRLDGSKIRALDQDLGPDERLSRGGQYLSFGGLATRKRPEGGLAVRQEARLVVALGASGARLPHGLEHAQGILGGNPHSQAVNRLDAHDFDRAVHGNPEELREVMVAGRRVEVGMGGVDGDAVGHRQGRRPARIMARVDHLGGLEDQRMVRHHQVRPLGDRRLERLGRGVHRNEDAFERLVGRTDLKAAIVPVGGARQGREGLDTGQEVTNVHG